jgi:hypothetical protein
MVMMRSLTAAELLTVWEHGLMQTPVQRAVMLLAAACGGTPTNALMRLSIGRRDARLLALRAWLFGSQIDGIVSCPGCGERLELAFDVSDIRASPDLPELGAADEEVESFEFNVADYVVCCRLPDSRDMLAIAGQADVAAIRRQLFKRCVLSAQHDGADLSAAELPDDIVAAIVAYMAEADPQPDVQIALACPVCTRQWQASFDIISYFWQEIDDWARRILREVHILASAYGWREDDILALSPRRRQLYLEMVGS